MSLRLVRGAAAAVSALACAVAQPAVAIDVGAYFPSTPGATWQYQVDSDFTATTRVLYDLSAIGPIPIGCWDDGAESWVPDASTFCLRSQGSGLAPVTECYTNDAAGLRLHYQFVGSFPALELLYREPLVLLQADAEPGQQVETPPGLDPPGTVQVRVSTLPTDAFYCFDYTAVSSFTSIGDVSVAAGTFEAAEVVLTTTVMVQFDPEVAPSEEVAVETLSLAEDLGLVQRIIEQGGEESTSELIEFSPGSVSRLQLVAELLEAPRCFARAAPDDEVELAVDFRIVNEGTAPSSAGAVAHADLYEADGVGTNSGVWRDEASCAAGPLGVGESVSCDFSPTLRCDEGELEFFFNACFTATHQDDAELQAEDCTQSVRFVPEPSASLGGVVVSVGLFALRRRRR